MMRKLEAGTSSTIGRSDDGNHDALTRSADLQKELRPARPALSPIDDRLASPSPVPRGCPKRDHAER